MQARGPLAKRFFSMVDAPSAGMRLTVAHGNALETDVLGELRLLFDELDELVNRLERQPLPVSSRLQAQACRGGCGRAAL